MRVRSKPARLGESPSSFSGGAKERQQASTWVPRLPLAQEPDISVASRLAAKATEIMNRCRGEGPPNCVARCPLHVDVRATIRLVQDGDFELALQMVRNSLPFPGILGFVCAHPCELHCKRLDEDSAVRIRDLERFLAEREPGPPQHLVDRAPESGRSVAVVGSGPAGLLAAHDLRRRGYRTVLFERDSVLGGSLATKIPENRLPAAVLERDLTIIEALDIEVRTKTAVGRDVSLTELSRQFDAVILSPGLAGARELLFGEGRTILDRTRNRTVDVDPLTCETDREGLFSAGDAVSGPGTVIEAMALGRRAAESAHRHLVGEPMRPGRSSPRPQGLMWSLSISETERLQRIRVPLLTEPASRGLLQDDAVEESRRCLGCECTVCVDQCEFLERYCRNPKDLVRQVIDDPESSQTRRMIYSCSLCSLCGRVCPEDLDIGSFVVAARKNAVETGQSSLSRHRLLRAYWKLGGSQTFGLVMPSPARSKAKRLFFTGCELPDVAPDKTVQIYKELLPAYPDMGVLMFCCAAPLEQLGINVDAQRSRLVEMVERVGAEELVTACPDCFTSLKAGLSGIRVTSVWQLLADVWQPPRLREGETVTVHDSCRARECSQLQESVRQLVVESGATVEEYEYSRERTRCCGEAASVRPIDPELARATSRRRAAESELPVVSYCAGCRDSLAWGGAKSVHLLDFLLAEDWEAEVARRPRWLPVRLVNRLRTKRRFSRLFPHQAFDP